MEQQHIALVRDSFSKVAPISEQAAELFYGKLFELDPKLESLFSGDMKEQGRKLMKMIAMAVNSLENLDQLVPLVQALGERHVGYGVKDEDYETVGAALIWTLEQGLGDDFTDEVHSAWAETYFLLSSVMKEAAAKAA